MMVTKEASEPRKIRLCRPEMHTWVLGEECPWGIFHIVTLYLNGFPHKRVIRRDPDVLVLAVREWLASPLPEWGMT